jgi:predicted nucleic acid-binding protein
LIGLDSSAFSRYLGGATDAMSMETEEALASGEAYLPPIVVTELLSNPWIAEANRVRVLAVPLIAILPGYWRRAADLRTELIRSRLKGNIADCLIAQSCIDHDIPLITYDSDFRHFAQAGLKLL